MTITARELLDTSSAHLRTLAAFLTEQLDESVAGSDDTLEVRACREVLQSLTALIPKIDALTRAPRKLPRVNHDPGPVNSRSAHHFPIVELRRQIRQRML